MITPRKENLVEVNMMSSEIKANFQKKRKLDIRNEMKKPVN